MPCTDTRIPAADSVGAVEGVSAKLPLEYYPEAFAAISGSTASASVKEALRSIVGAHLEASAGRAEAALQRSLERSQAIRAGISEAVGALPADTRGAAGVVQRRIARRGPEFYKLKRIPDISTIRAVLSSQMFPRTSTPEPAPADISLTENPPHE